MTQEFRLLLTAWVFFTRVPLPAALAAWVGYSPAMLRGSARYFPLVGVAVGAVAAATYIAGAWLFTLAVAMVLSMIATVLMTGAFHEDGLADSCDGFGGAYTRERVLEIMQDSRVGAFGAIGIMLMLLLKYASLNSLADTGPKAKPLADGISSGAFMVALVITALPFVLVAEVFENGWLLALGLAPVGLAAWAAGAYFRRRIGGYTGDCLGAAQQVAEVAFYLFAAGLLLGFEVPPA